MSKNVVVQRNAPGWPAMVSSKFSSDQKALREKIKAMKETKSGFENAIQNSREQDIATAHRESNANSSEPSISASTKATSMWLMKRYGGNESTVSQQQTPKPSPFAPKLVRQCGSCQMLYTNFHSCQETDGEQCYGSSSSSKK